MLVIRDGRADELDEIADLIAAAYAQFGPPPGSAKELVDAFDEYRVDQRDVWSRLVDSQLIVAEEEGRLVGAVTFYPPGAEKKSERWPPEWAAFRLLAVPPDARGKGVGRALTDECLRRARDLGAPVMGLHTTIVMDVARAMYERMGFTRFPENDFPITDDFVVMAYTLPL
ncbi:MAG: GNAT family N-acetyltransferase [Actinobacteria bacterium]|nr:MAG: GNAT family N-acetyltransferase [Actinomycetota bacterium]